MEVQVNSALIAMQSYFDEEVEKQGKLREVFEERISLLHKPG